MNGNLVSRRGRKPSHKPSADIEQLNDNGKYRIKQAAAFMGRSESCVRSTVKKEKEGLITIVENGHIYVMGYAIRKFIATHSDPPRPARSASSPARPK